MNISENILFEILTSVHLHDINRAHEMIDEYGLNVVGITFDCVNRDDEVYIPFIDIWVSGYAFSHAKQKFSSNQFTLHWGSSTLEDENEIDRFTISCDYHKETTDGEFVRDLCNLSLAKVTSTDDVTKIVDIIDTVRKAKSL